MGYYDIIEPKIWTLLLNIMITSIINMQLTIRND